MMAQQGKGNFLSRLRRKHKIALFVVVGLVGFYVMKAPAQNVERPLQAKITDLSGNGAFAQGPELGEIAPENEALRREVKSLKNDLVERDRILARLDANVQTLGAAIEKEVETRRVFENRVDRQKDRQEALLLRSGGGASRLRSPAEGSAAMNHSSPGGNGPQPSPVSMEMAYGGPVIEPRMRMIYLTEDGTPPKDDVSAQSPQKVYFPAGSFAQAVTLNGVDAAPDREGLALPLFMKITGAFHAPGNFRVPAHGCHAIGKASASLSQERVLVEVVRMSCVYEDGTVFEPEIKATVKGPDGSIGIPGKVKDHRARMMGGAILASSLKSFADAVRAAQSTTIITPIATNTEYKNGVLGPGVAGAASGAMDRVAAFYEREAERLFPVVHIDPGIEVEIPLMMGVSGVDKSLVEGVTPW